MKIQKGHKLRARVSPSESESVDEVELEIVDILNHAGLSFKDEKVDHTFFHVKPEHRQGIFFNRGQSLPWHMIESHEGGIFIYGNGYGIEEEGVYLVDLAINIDHSPDERDGLRIELRERYNSVEPLFTIPIKGAETRFTKAVRLKASEYEFALDHGNGINSVYTKEGCFLKIIRLDTIFPNITPEMGTALFERIGAKSFGEGFLEDRGMLDIDMHEVRMNLTDCGSEFVQSRHPALKINRQNAIGFPKLEIDIDDEALVKMFEESSAAIHRASQKAAENLALMNEAISLAVNRAIQDFKKLVFNPAIDAMPDAMVRVAQEQIQNGVNHWMSQIGVNVESLRERVDERDAKFIQVIDDLQDRIKELEEKESEVVEIEPVSLADHLRKAQDGMLKKKRSESEKEIDELAWPVLDASSRLHEKGGSYAIQWLFDDILKQNEGKIERRDLAGIDLEDLTASALRYAQVRSKWYLMRKYWVTVAGEFIIVRRDRLKEQAMEPKDTEGDFLKGF